MIKMVIKFCDISNPSKNWENHMRWTRLITEEFYLQGDEEKKRGLQRTDGQGRTDGRTRTNFSLPVALWWIHIFLDLGRLSNLSSERK